MARSHIHRMRIAFSDCDPAQIVFFANYFKWFDTAFREFCTACGVPSWRETTATRGIIGAPLVDAQAKFPSADVSRAPKLPVKKVAKKDDAPEPE